MPDLARARPLAEVVSTATQASQLPTDLLGSDKNTSSSQDRQTPTTMPCDDSGLALTSGPSIPNRGPWRQPSPLQRSRPFTLGDTVTAKAYRKSLLHVSEETRYGRRGRSDIGSSHRPGPFGAVSTRYHGGSNPTQTSSRSQSPLFTTGGAARGHSGAPQDAVATRDDLDPSEVTPTVLVSLVTGEVSKENQCKIAGNLFRSAFGGNG